MIILHILAVCKILFNNGLSMSYLYYIHFTCHLVLEYYVFDEKV